MRKADSATVAAWLDNMAGSLQSLLTDTPLNDVAMLGIQSGGVRIADMLHQRLDLPTPLGTLNIAFYRDDFSRIGLHPQVTPSELPFEVEERTIILVDDVLYSGRTVRAALNEIFDYGRPARIILAVLVERDGHELPIRADVAGHRLALSESEQVKLHPTELILELIDANTGQPA